jgi:Zn-dependent protease with chaperone function
VGAFVARGDVKEVRAAVRKQLEAQNFVVEEANLPTTTLIAARRFDRLWNNVTARIRLEPYRNVTLVDAKFKMGLLYQAVFLALLVYMSTILVLLALYIEEFAIAARDILVRIGAYLIGSVLGGISKNVITDLPERSLMSIGALVTIYPAFRLICKLDTNGSTSLTEDETAFWNFLKKNFPLRLMAFAKLHPLSVNPTICWNILILTIGSILLFKMPPIVFYVVFPYFLYIFMAILMPLFYEHSPILYHRTLVVRNNAVINVLSSQILLLAAAGFVTSIIYDLNQQHGNESTPISIATIRQCIEARQSLIGNPISAAEAVQGLSKDATHYTEEVVQKFPNSAEKKNVIEKIFLLANMLPIFAMFCGVLLFAVLLFVQVVEFPTKWHNYAGKNDVDWIRLPAEVESRGVHNKPFQITILLVFIAGAVLNTLVLLVAVDALWFILSGHTLLFTQTQTLLTWVLVPFLIADKITGTQNPWFWSFTVKLIIIIFGLLPLIIVSRRISAICHNSISRFIYYMLGSFSSHQVPKNLVQHVNDLCKKYAVNAPKVVKTPEKTVYLSVLPSYVVGKPIIFISEGAVSKLTEAEMKAAITHEIGHIKQGVRKYHLLRIASVICGHPPWFLLLLVDLRKLEDDADKFALQAGAEPSALASAIIKTTIPEYFDDSQLSPSPLIAGIHIPVINSIRKVLRLISVIDHFSCGDELVGSSHPLPRDRIATILAGTKVTSDTA